MLVFCPVEHQHAVRQALDYMTEMPVKLDHLGTRVVLNITRDIWS